MLRKRSLRTGTAPRPRRRLRVLLLVVLLVTTWYLFGQAPAPQLALSIAPDGIGPEAQVTAVASEPRFGLSAVEVILRQAGEQRVVAAEKYAPRSLLWPWGDKTARSSVTAEVGHRRQSWLVDGEAEVVVRATRHAGRWRQPAPSEQLQVVTVQVTPPRLEVLSVGVRVRQGGSEAVVYRVGERAVRHGVRAGDHWFPGSSLAGEAGQFFALFSAPWDDDRGDSLRLTAEDALGNRAEVPFVDHFTPKPVGTSTIQLSDRFLERVVPPIVARVPGLEPLETPLATYLEINGRLRAENRARLVELGAQSAEAFLWSEPFLPFPGGQVMDAFARRRDYRYQGSTVDQQVHLGYDLASVARAEVPAANAGRVLLADYLGIYGNVVVLDHGYGLLTLYAHLSSLEVATGQTVTRGQTLGRTGTTGLAGGDHLHFATLLRGLPVDPLEWWDRRWIETHLGSKLGPNLPLGMEAR